MEKEEGLILKSLGWQGKGLIQSAHDLNSDKDPHSDSPDGNPAEPFKLVTDIYLLKASLE